MQSLISFFVLPTSILVAVTVVGCALIATCGYFGVKAYKELRHENRPLVTVRAVRRAPR